MDSERPPVAGAVATAAAGGLWGSGLLLAGDLLAGAGVWLVTIVTLAGLLVARSRWAVRTSLVLAAIAVPAVLVVDQPVLVGLGIAASAITVWAVLGAGTAAGVRPFGAANAPPDEAVVLMLLLVGAPAALGLAALGSDPSTVTIAAALVGPVLAWWFGRRSAAALWLSRTAAPLVFLASAVLEGWPRGVAGVALAGAVGWYAWRPAVRIAAIPLEPTKSDAKPIFAQFAPAEIREAAGLDERGYR